MKPRKRNSISIRIKKKEIQSKDLLPLKNIAATRGIKNTNIAMVLTRSIVSDNPVFLFTIKLLLLIFLIFSSEHRSCSSLCILSGKIVS
ncbi:hypothetical protein ABID31_001466 [Chryseobacterium flavum]|uniref:hypothetical protein n=1 Tax=Chryseobacterium flavum TaxID=415851 RepID=UPI000F50184C|nr:hypothetical protein [Chryseobacterium flavum]